MLDTGTKSRLFDGGKKVAESPIESSSDSDSAESRASLKSGEGILI